MVLMHKKGKNPVGGEGGDAGRLLIGVIATRQGYGWLAGGYWLVEVPGFAVTTVDGIGDFGEDREAIENAARSAIMSSAEDNGGIGEDGEFDLDVTFDDSTGLG